MDEQTNDALPGYDYWTTEHAEHPIADWKYEVENGYTRLGYWQWVKQRLNED